MTVVVTSVAIVANVAVADRDRRELAADTGGAFDRVFDHGHVLLPAHRQLIE